MPTACPACHQPMVASKLIDQPVQICSNCHGLWLPETALNKIVRLKRDLSDPPAGTTPSAFLAAMRAPLQPRGHGAMVCPQCQKPLRMQIYRGSGVPVDQCYPCISLFLDAGELKLIYEFTHSPRRAAQRAEIEKLFKEHDKNVGNALSDMARAREQLRNATGGSGLL